MHRNEPQQPQPSKTERLPDLPGQKDLEAQQPTPEQDEAVRGGALNAYISRPVGEKQSISDGTSNTILFAEKLI